MLLAQAQKGAGVADWTGQATACTSKDKIDHRRQNVRSAMASQSRASGIVSNDI